MISSGLQASVGDIEQAGVWKANSAASNALARHG